MRKFKKWTAAALSLMLLGSLTACQKNEAEKAGQEGAAKRRTQPKSWTHWSFILRPQKKAESFRIWK